MLVGWVGVVERLCWHRFDCTANKVHSVGLPSQHLLLYGLWLLSALVRPMAPFRLFPGNLGSRQDHAYVGSSRRLHILVGGAQSHVEEPTRG